MRILVTGSHGLIGSALLKSLDRIGHQTLTFDIRSNKNQNIQDPSSFDLFKKIDGIVHLAGTSQVALAEKNPDLCRLNNVLGTRNVIRKALSLKKKPWLIFSSSREVYGQQKVLPVNEDAARQTISVYAKTKCLAENLVLEAREHGLTTAIVRFSDVFGSITDYPNRTIPAFCLAALKNKPLHLKGPQNVFDFTYLDDVIRGVMHVVNIFNKNSSDSLPPIHLVNGRGISLFEAASIITRKAGGGSIETIEPQPYDVNRFYGCNERAMSLLGWKPQYTFEKAITKYLGELKENGF